MRHCLGTVMVPQGIGQMVTVRRDGRGHYFAYSVHATREEAEDALSQYYAEGRISESEAPRIDVNRLSRIGLTRRPFQVMFPI
jgi:hypothetical protein